MDGFVEVLEELGVFDRWFPAMSVLTLFAQVWGMVRHSDGTLGLRVICLFGWGLALYFVVTNFFVASYCEGGCKSDFSGLFLKLAIQVVLLNLAAIVASLKVIPRLGTTDTGSRSKVK